MKSKFLKSTLGVVVTTALLTIAVLSCNKKNDVVPTDGNPNSPSNLRVTSCSTECSGVSCAEIPDSVVFNTDTINWTGGRPPAPADLYFDFNTASVNSTSGQLKMSGNFNSFLTGVGCWTVGYLPTIYNCNDLDELDCSTIKDSTKTADICGTGLGNQTGSCPGWYTYVSPVATTIRLVSVFCDGNGNGEWDSVESGYVLCIEVEPFQTSPTPPADIWARYTLKYKCCPAE